MLSSRHLVFVFALQHRLRDLPSVKSKTVVALWSNDLCFALLLFLGVLCRLRSRALLLEVWCGRSHSALCSNLRVFEIRRARFLALERFLKV